MGALPAGIRNALAIPADNATKSIEDVQHIVILMQENRSFDHYFGTLRGVRGYGDKRAITLPGGKPVWYQPLAGDAGYVLPFRPISACSSFKTCRTTGTRRTRPGTAATTINGCRRKARRRWPT